MRVRVGRRDGDSIEQSKVEMDSRHFWNSLDEDCGPVVTDTNTKGTTENKNAYGRRVCEMDKQRRPGF